MIQISSRRGCFARKLGLKKGGKQGGKRVYNPRFKQKA